jgi:hypothetical protein
MIASAILISFLGYCAVLSRRIRWPVELVPLTVISSICCFLYLSAVFSLLVPAIYLIFAGGLICLAVFFIEGRSDIRQSLARFLTPGMVLFIIMSVFVWLRFKGCVYNDWDEFTIWGRMAKEMHVMKGLIGPESSMRFKDYPPGAALLQVFLTTFTGFSEGMTFVALNFTILCALTIFQCRISWKSWPCSLLMLACSVVAVLMWGRTFDTIYVDHLLGLFFGAALASYMFAPNPRRDALMRLMPVFFFIALIKPSGIYFAAVASAFIWTDNAVDFLAGAGASRSPQGEAASERFSPERRDCLMRTALLLIVLTALPFVSQGIWKSRLKAMAFAKSWPVSFTFSEALRSFSEREGSPRESEIIDRFVQSLSTSDLSYLGGVSRLIRLTPRTGLVLLLAAAIAAMMLHRGALFRIRTAAGQAVLLTGWAIYMAGLLVILYLHYFHDEESVRLASFARYTATYYIGWTMVVLALYQMLLTEKRSNDIICPHVSSKAGNQAAESRGAVGPEPCRAGDDALLPDISENPTDSVKYRASMPVMAVALLSLFVCAFCDVHHYEAPREIVQFRRDVQKQLSSIKDLSPLDDSFYIVWQNIPGAPKVMLSYELSPRKTNENGWSLGKPYSDKDIWTVDKTTGEWAAELAGYDYLLVGKGDEQFWRLYGELFEEPAESRKHGLFRVIRIDDRTVRLRIMK